MSLRRLFLIISIKLTVFIIDNILILLASTLVYLLSDIDLAYILIVALLVFFLKVLLRRSKKIVIFTSSAGGHNTQLNLLMRKIKLEGYNYIKVTERVKYRLKETYKTKYLIYGSRAEKFIYPLKLFINIILTMRIYAKTRPQYIISTGVHSTIPLMIVGIAYRRTQTIYVESFAKTHTPTMTGSFVYKHNLADLFLVQWPDMLDVFPNAVYGGGVYWS